MFVLETFDQELYERDLKQDAYEAGMKVGIQIERESFEYERRATLISNIENIMKNLDVNAEEACKIMGITLEEYEKTKIL